MFRSVSSRKPGYAILAILFAGSITFQFVLSAEALQHIWSAGRHFRPDMLTWWDLEFFGHVLTPIACLLLGFYVAGVRIWDGRAWLLLAVLISFSLQADGANTHDEVMLWTTPLKHPALAYRSFGVYTFPFWLALFAIYFPEQAEWEQRNSKLKWSILIPVAALSCWMAVLRTAANETNAPAVKAARDAASGYWRDIFYFSVAFFLVVFSLKLVSAKSPDSRRRLRVLLFGIALTLVPLTMLDVIASILRIPEEKLPVWLLGPIFPLVLSFPVTVAYVTVVQRALDLGVAIRQSLQYALARRGVVLLQMFVSVIVIFAVAGVAGHTSFVRRLILTGLGIAAVLLVGIAAKRLGSWIDRQFFREAYNTEQILNRLAESVSSMVELAPLLKTVATRIAETLHISKVAVFLCEQNVYRPAFSLGYSQPEHAVFDRTAFTIRELNRRREPLRIYVDNPRFGAAKVGGTEANILRDLDAQLMLPLARKDELLGFITLGPKHSEAPYSTTDVNLLQSVASQTALAVENSRLTSAIANETAEREVIQRELSIAREVQQRLFPQSYPGVPGLEYHGTCRPAQEVGGDYYDFIELPNHSLGVAIGDVSGKGIPASLLMASFRLPCEGKLWGHRSALIVWWKTSTGLFTPPRL
ncbi:MAG: GAF domain-containing protein [Bryobacteraceae bacterium]